MTVDTHHGVTLTCSVSSTEAALLLNWHIYNGGAKDVGLFTRVQVPADGLSSTRQGDGAYIDLDDTTLRVDRACPAIPDGIRVNVRPVPGIVLLSRGEELSETLVLNRPLRVYQPLRLALLRVQAEGRAVLAIEPKPAVVMMLTIGFFALREGLRLLPMGEGKPDVFRAWPSGPAVDNQQLVQRTVALPTIQTILDYVIAPDPSRR